MFAMQKSLKGILEQRTVGISPPRCAEMQDTHGEFFPQQSFVVCLVLCDNL